MTFFGAFALDVTEVGETVELACRYFRQLGLAEFDARRLEIARRFHVGSSSFENPMMTLMCSLGPNQ
jgi:hypothetical protein